MNPITLLVFTHNEEIIFPRVSNRQDYWPIRLSSSIPKAPIKQPPSPKRRSRSICFSPPSLCRTGRGFGIAKAKTDWVFILDADERITPELANELKSVILEGSAGRRRPIGSQTDSIAPMVAPEWRITKFREKIFLARQNGYVMALVADRQTRIIIKSSFSRGQMKSIRLRRYPAKPDTSNSLLSIISRRPGKNGGKNDCFRGYRIGIAF